MPDTEMKFIRSGDALFRGYYAMLPLERWDEDAGWVKYTGQTPKPFGWGEVIDKAEAESMMEASPL